MSSRSMERTLCAIILVILLASTFTLPFASANNPPVANAGESQEVKVGQIVFFGGSDSYDPDGFSLTYSWDFDASDGIQIDSNVVAPRHTYTVPGMYTVTLTVSDGIDHDTDIVTVKVNPNLPPVVDLGQDITVGLNEWVYLDARNTSDPNHDPLTYSWDYDASDGIQEDNTEKMPRWKYSKTGRYTVTLTVSDGEFEVNGTVNVTVEAMLIMVAGKKYIEDNTVGSGLSKEYLISISKGKGLEVKIASKGTPLNYFLFESANYFDYTETGMIMAISQGSKENASKISYKVIISKTDEYYIMVHNPSSTGGTVAYHISIKVLDVDEAGGVFSPGPGALDLLLCMLLATMLVAFSRRKD